jgi:hypothetical protein
VIAEVEVPFAVMDDGDAEIVVVEADIAPGPTAKLEEAEVANDWVPLV